MADTIWGSTKKPVSSRRLAENIEAIPNLEGTLYVGYPVLGTPSGAFTFDAVLLSPTHGVVIFDLIEGREIGDYRHRQDEFYTRLKSKLLQYPKLVTRRDLAVPITVVTFISTSKHSPVESSDDFPVAGTDDLVNLLDNVQWAKPDVYPELASSIQALSTIRKGRKRREPVREDLACTRFG